jgi:hypothetical protein
LTNIYYTVNILIIKRRLLNKMITNGRLGIGDKVLISGMITEIKEGSIIIEIQTEEKTKTIIEINKSALSVAMPL